MEILIDGETTKEDTQRALALIFGRRRQTGVALLVSAAVLVLVFGILVRMTGQTEWIVFLDDVVLLAFILLFVGASLWQLPWFQARQYESAPLLRGRVTGMATDEALELRSEYSEGKTRWNAYVQYKMSDEVVLLYQNWAVANIIPRGYFGSDEDWQRFREHVRANVPEKVKAQGGILRWRWLVYAIIILIAVGAALVGWLGSR